MNKVNSLVREIQYVRRRIFGEPVYNQVQLFDETDFSDSDTEIQEMVRRNYPQTTVIGMTQKDFLIWILKILGIIFIVTMPQTRVNLFDLYWLTCYCIFSPLLEIFTTVYIFSKTLDSTENYRPIHMEFNYF